MRALVQRVAHAQVEVAGEVTGKVGRGLLILFGVTESDSEEEVKFLAQKISKLRIFSDDTGKMNLSLVDVGGAALVVSQFTLYADARRGNRPSYIRAARPEQAEGLYQTFVKLLGEQGVETATGVFGADMKVSLLNDGPVTLWLDTAELRG